MRILPGISAIACSIAVAAVAAAEPAPPSDAVVRSAAARALALLQRSVTAWDTTQTCFSCHHQGMVITALRAAREHGVPIDETAAQKSTSRVFRTLGNIDLAVQAVQQIDPAMATASWLMSASASGAAPNLVTAVYARDIAWRQQDDGHWLTPDARPPQAFSAFTATATAAKAIRTHLPASLAAERDARTERARTWLRSAVPQETEDRTFQLLGLAWAGEPASSLQSFAERLLAEQRADGGWSQLASRESDAYATGQALYALRAAGGVSPTHPAWQRGLQFLLTTQGADGSWLVRTRIHEHDLVSPPFFETGYPHGRDQISSFNGAAWAAMALMEALPVTARDATVLPPYTVEVSSGGASRSQPAWMTAALFGSASDLTALLDKGLDPNTRTAAGTTLLMMAAHDPAKVRLLLATGADPRAVSQARHTALMIAANHRGALESMTRLLDAGAPAGPAPGAERKGRAGGVSPLLYAVWSGEPEKVALLLARGATMPKRFAIGGGLFFAAPLELAVFLRDAPMARLLVSRGADVNALGETGVSPLSGAVLGDDAAMVRTLLDLGAAVNLVDQQGETALMHAAQIDYGNTDVIDALLAAGADRGVLSPDKLTAQALADKYGHAGLSRRLYPAPD